MAPPRQTKAKPGRAPKTALDIAEQLHTVRQMLTMGRSPFEIRQALALQYGLPERTAERRIAEARQQMVRELEMIDRKELAAQLIRTAEEILGEARESRQLSNALGALGVISRLTGLEPKG
jgi:DNA-binding transcriptional MerR regulator